ncbi:cytochrome b [Methylobacterium nigriterrae]|uniref:cytochrome b n=1 Tax=Methylobacterium nigriterrae TaxID=3127512 RepID=UPI0030139A70
MPETVASRAPEHHQYGATAQALHWITAILVAAVLPLAWVGTSLARDAPGKGPVFVLHKSVGLTILALVVARILWRMVRPAPPDPKIPAGLALIARASHWLLYAVFLIMPVSGYLLSAYGGRGTPYFWLFTVPGFTRDEGLHHLFEQVHRVGQWAAYALVILHVAGTVWHIAIRRDGVHERMLPAQKAHHLGPG